MEFFAPHVRPIIGPVVMLPQKGAVTGGSKRPPNSYAISGSTGTLLFDAVFSWNLDAIEAMISTAHPPLALVLSHRHLVSSGDAFHEIKEHYELPVLLHPDDHTCPSMSRLPMAVGDPTGGKGLEILQGVGAQLIHIPGHTAGSIMLYLPQKGGILLTGDAAVGPGPIQPDQTPRLERPIGADTDPCFIPIWKEVVGSLPIAAILPLHGAYYLRCDLGSDVFDAIVENIWKGHPMDPRQI
ncbi:MBL fold metallo-hydrolase [uncultured Sulfitobacter sp.]|uniref:MBL fold metallo-hydrolase n=1 Tax=uncultured Sulfitobacter sp. TaxID=191468 RepID=UPI00262DE661|nr:MBL fold metallo-hydrolase [uncultured Sulfitobacter sp.]